MTVFDALRFGYAVSEKKSRHEKNARSVADHVLGLRDVGALDIGHFLHPRAEAHPETPAEELDEFGPEDGIGILSLMAHTPASVSSVIHRRWLNA